MKKAIIVMLGLAILIIGLACGKAEQQPKQQITLSEAQAQAAKEGKPLLLDFYAEWCGPCKMFTKASHEDVDIMKALEGVVLHKIDCEKGEGIELAKKYEVRGYPTFIIVNADLKQINRWMGYSKEYFLENIAKTLSDLTPIEDKIARFGQNPTLDDALALAGYSDSKEDYKNAVIYFTKAAELDPNTNYSFKIFENTVGGTYNQDFTYDDAVIAAGKVFTSDNIDNQIQAAGSMAELAGYLNKLEDMAKYLEQGISLVDKTDNPEIKEYGKSLNVEYNLHVKADTTKAIEYQKSTYGDGWTEDANRLNSFSWWCYENGVNLEEAEQLATKAVGLSAPGSAKAMILDTVAHICKARGNMAGAIKYMELAVKEDSTNSQWQETLDGFKKEAEETPAN